jgi:hypothetical protein
MASDLSEWLSYDCSTSAMLCLDVPPAPHSFAGVTEGLLGPYFFMYQSTTHLQQGFE